MGSYYTRTLAGDRLRRCYEIAPPRVQRYLQEEASFVCGRLGSSDVVLELGCGYGRFVWPLARVAGQVVGIDLSHENLRLARALTDRHLPCRFAAMDASKLGFAPASFDVVVCVQNGICAFHVNAVDLLREALRVVRSPGRVLFSTYSERIWPDRLDWFRLQAAQGLVGAIDEQATRPGTIVCRDGFSVGTMTPDLFRQACAELRVAPTLTEVDQSSLFCEIAG
jgi:2-polyprenyl-6-hydroxyphenyl methylase/3-demethylubiquinone-9 3-methyltransferase